LGVILERTVTPIHFLRYNCKTGYGRERDKELKAVESGGVREDERKKIETDCSGGGIVGER
jgi:hypothetical protein